MNSTKFLLKTYPQHPKGYGIMNWLDEETKESYIWAKIQGLIPKGSKYLNHFVEQDWIENENYPINDESNKDGIMGRSFAVGIPKGDLNYWLIVYWEE